MSLTEISLNIPTEHVANVFGQFDAYIKKIERTLNVTVVVRGDSMKLIGNERQIKSASNVFMQLLELSKRGNVITEQNVNYALSLAAEAKESAIVEIDKDWVPHIEGASLYIRPFIFAADPFLGVRPSNTYKFIIILSPVGAYYESGLDPVKIWIEDDYVRAVRGGIGEAKTGGNYVASLAAQVKAHDEGYSQVLWLDGVERKYIEEVGAMNIFFKINGTVVTPMLNGSILPGVTRASCIDLCKHWGLPVEERRISVDELVEAARTGALEECWGSGTAAVISPVGALRYENEVMQIKDGGIGEFSQKLYDTVTGIQTGKVEDTLGWTVEVTPLEK